MTSVCHIVCAGLCDALHISREPDDLVIAVDGGFAHCLEAGIEPDLFVGDLDSLDATLVDRIDCERIELPCDKDDTDTLFACKVGLDRGYDVFALHAALGGDVGHELANIQTLAFLAQRGATGTLLGRTQTIDLVTPQASPRAFKAPVGTRVSVLAFGGDAHGVTECGLRWELDDATLSPDFPLGVSNRSSEPTFEVGVREGMLVVAIGS